MARDRYVVSDDNSDSASVVRPRRIEVLAGAERRRKWADETKIAIVAEALTPGTVVSDVARRHDVVPSQVFGWMRKFRAEALAIIEAPSFAPAVVDVEGTPSTIAADAPVSAAPIEITVGTATVRVRESVDARTLAIVLKALKVLA